jgi:uncharacterized protein (TIGR02453 family)
MLSVATINFLKNLKKNNNKPWFEANRKKYEDAKADFAQFIQTIIEKHAKKDKTLKNLKAKDCMFRINRDVRFSKDKSPYKSNFGASINRGGKKSIYAGYYFHCQPGEHFVGGGIWMPMPPELKMVRQEIDYNFDEFKKIIGSKKFRAAYGQLYTGDDVSLTKVPQGFEKDSPAGQYLKLKSYLAMKKLSDLEITSKDLEKQALQAFAALQPLVEFINQGLDN